MIPASQLKMPKYTSQEKENSRKYQAYVNEQAKKEKLKQLDSNIAYCESKINDVDFLQSATDINCKSLLLFRISLIKEKEDLLK